MTFDTTTVIVLVAILAAAILLWLLLRSRRAPARVERREAEPYVARQDRPYMKPPDAEAGSQGGGVADEYATAATDVAGDVLGVEARAELPGAIGAPDNLELLKGVGPKFAARLNELGIRRFDQIAALNDNEMEMLDSRLGPFRGRLTRDRVVEQASYLSRGDVEGFEDRFGKLGA